VPVLDFLLDAISGRPMTYVVVAGIVFVDDRGHCRRARRAQHLPCHRRECRCGIFGDNPF
jgi:hypothetical protein